LLDPQHGQRFALVFTEVTADMIRDLRASGADGEEQSDIVKLGFRYLAVNSLR
jgi:hypothetical protein